MKKICLIYTHLPHYRVAIFNELLNSNEYDYEIYYDPTGVDTSIISGEITNKSYKIKTYKLGRFMFQPASFKLALFRQYHGYIFLGNPYILSNWIIFIILRLRNKKIFLWTHGWLSDERGLKDSLRTLYYKLTNHLMLYGENAQIIANKKGFPYGKTTVIYNSLNYNFQSNIRKSIKNLIIQKKHFLFVGRIKKEIQLEIAINAIGLINRFHSEVRLLIVGDGSEVERLKYLSKKQNANVHFIRATYQEEKLAELFMSAFAVVSPGKVGLLAMHSFAYGIPVITSGNAKMQMPESEIIEDGVTGSLCSELSAELFASKMEFWLHSKELEVTSVACIKAIEKKYTPQKQKDIIESMFAKVLKD